MKQSPSREANKFSASQGISRILWNAKVLYSIHKCQLFVHILSQMNPVHTSRSHCLKIHFIILPCKSTSSKLSFSLRTSDQNYVWTSPFSIRCLIPRLSHSSWFGHPYNIWWGVQIIKGDQGSTVVKVLCYKSEGRWFDPSWCQWIFRWHKTLPIALWPWGRLSL